MFALPVPALMAIFPRHKIPRAMRATEARHILRKLTANSTAHPSQNVLATSMKRMHLQQVQTESAQLKPHAQETSLFHRQPLLLPIFSAKTSRRVQSASIPRQIQPQRPIEYAHLVRRTRLKQRSETRLAHRGAHALLVKDLKQKVLQLPIVSVGRALLASTTRLQTTMHLVKQLPHLARQAPTRTQWLLNWAMCCA